MAIIAPVIASNIIISSNLNAPQNNKSQNVTHFIQEMPLAI